VAEAGIFISYRRDDSSGYVGRLDEDLGVHFGRDEIFRDLEDISPGAVFPDRLTAAIDASMVVLAVIGRRWLERVPGAESQVDWVVTELARAMANQKPVIPVVVHQATFPPPSLPPELQALATREAVTLSDQNWRADVNRLIDAIEGFGVVRSDESSFAEDPPGSRVEARDRWLVRDSPEVVWKQIHSFLSSQKMRWRGDGDTIHLAGGNRLAARVLGLLGGPPTRLPTVGQIRVRDLGARVSIEALIREDWGVGLLKVGGGDQRYRLWFEQWMRDLREATGAPREPIR
jgi:hypothetical protein